MDYNTLLERKNKRYAQFEADVETINSQIADLHNQRAKLREQVGDEDLVDLQEYNKFVEEETRLALLEIEKSHQAQAELNSPKEVKDAAYFADKYPAIKIKTVAKNLGLKNTGTEISVAQSILLKITPEEFEKLLNQL